MLFAFLGARVVDVKAAGVYDPCVDDDTVNFKKSFTIGLAYFPNGTVDDWGDLNPCDDEHRTKLKDLSLIHI